MKKAALFDMDGTLVDNTAAHIRAFEIFCARYGVTDWKERLSQGYGMGNDDIMRMIMPEEVIRTKGLAALAEEKEAIYREIYAPEIHPVAGLRELLEGLHTRGVRCAVGSSGCRKNVDFVLEKCAIGPWFEARISGDAVTHCKPDPEIYLTAAAALGITNEVTKGPIEQQAIAAVSASMKGLTAQERIHTALRLLEAPSPTQELWEQVRSILRD